MTASMRAKSSCTPKGFVTKVDLQPMPQSRFILNDQNLRHARLQCATLRGGLRMVEGNSFEFGGRRERAVRSARREGQARAPVLHFLTTPPAHGRTRRRN